MDRSVSLAKPFAVVKFPDEGDAVSVVREKWIKHGMCLWPPKVKNFAELVKNEAERRPGWISTSCVVLGSFENYHEARSKMTRAEMTSSPEMEIGDPERKITKRNFIYKNSDSDEPAQPYARSIRPPPTPPNAASLMNGSENELAMPVLGGHCSQVMRAKQPPVLQFRKTAKGGPTTRSVLKRSAGSQSKQKRATQFEHLDMAPIHLTLKC
ncbi:hypothetical protein V5799_010928 [Amblyomma americanum]|uniref:Uncharacterized protein n=1 Tax=Amblyomma americanum TaxID=6943 RepID=A0AAQ4EIB7_AMBAM